MSATPVTPKFNFSYATLEQLGDKFAILIQRDATALADFGIDNQRLADLQQRIDAFKKHLNDVYYQGNVSIAVETKNKWRTDLQSQVRRLLSRYELAFGRETAHFERANIANLSQLSDREMASRVRSLLSFATTDLPQLTTAGQTAANLTDMQTLLTALDDAIDLVETEIMNRDTATQTRAQLANAVYDTIAQIALAGKTAFADTDEARYNDYIIYDRPRRSTAKTITIAPNTTEVVLTGTTDTDEIYAELVAGASNVQIAASDGNSATFDADSASLNLGQNGVFLVADLSDGTGYSRIIVHNPTATPAEIFVDKYDPADS